MIVSQSICDNKRGIDVFYREGEVGGRVGGGGEKLEEGRGVRIRNRKQEDKLEGRLFLWKGKNLYIEICIYVLIQFFVCVYISL